MDERLEKLKNGTLSPEEAVLWEEELAKEPEALLSWECEALLSLVYLVRREAGIGAVEAALGALLREESLVSADMLSEENEETYRKYHAWSREILWDGALFGILLGDYFFGIDPVRAEGYYREAFAAASPSDEVEFEAFCRYLSLVEDKDGVLDRAAASASGVGGVWVRTKRLRMGRESGRFAGEDYLGELDAAILAAEEVVEKYRRGYVPDWSDSDSERAHLELLCDRLAYFVDAGDAPRAMEEYRRVTDAIGRSDCTRYYHARDYYYRRLLSALQEKTPALGLAMANWEGRRRIAGDLEVGKDVTVWAGELSLSFRVLAKSGNGATLAPHLGEELGLGGAIFVTLGMDEEGLYIEPAF